MKVTHRHLVSSWFTIPESDPVEPEYEAEVQQATQRGERNYRKAQERLTRAEARLSEAIQAQEARKRITQLRQEVDLRRAELEDCRRLMAAAPVVQADKQVRHRAGLDDHLELGVLKRPRRKKSAHRRSTAGRTRR
jgi:hypothetical protein